MGGGWLAFRPFPLGRMPYSFLALNSRDGGPRLMAWEFRLCEKSIQFGLSAEGPLCSRRTKVLSAARIALRSYTVDHSSRTTIRSALCAGRVPKATRLAEQVGACGAHAPAAPKQDEADVERAQAPCRGQCACTSAST